MEWLGVVLLYLLSGFMKKRQQNARRREIELNPDWDSENNSSYQEKEPSNKLDQLLNDLFEDNPKIPEIDPLSRVLVQNANQAPSIGDDKKTIEKNDLDEDIDFKENNNEQFQDTPFIEIAPLDYEIDNSRQRDLSSVPISEIEFPKVVYMVVDNKIELEIKYLRDYPQWDFLPNSDLNRKTIEIFNDIKVAKRFCKKEQKVIKVPNTDVFRIAAHILISRGISRIVSSEQLIAL